MIFLTRKLPLFRALLGVSDIHATIFHGDFRAAGFLKSNFTSVINVFCANS